MSPDPNRSGALARRPNRSAEPVRRAADPAVRHPIRRRSVRPGWDGPTGEQPIVYSRGRATPWYGRPALVADERPVPIVRLRRSWRPDLWPWWVWGPVSVAPAVLVALVVWLVCVLW